MRGLAYGITLLSVALLPDCVHAGSPGPRPLPQITVTPRAESSGANALSYRGHSLDVSALAGRSDTALITEALRRQVDIVEDSGASERVLRFVRSMPIVIDDFACPGHTAAEPAQDQKANPTLPGACYGRELSTVMRRGDFVPVERSNRLLGVVMYRPQALTTDRDRPVLLHELMHAFHDHILADGFGNQGIKSWYKKARDDSRYPAGSHLLTNEQEFFAVTASVFLSGSDGEMTRAKLKEAQPDYYRYLAWLFEFDPGASDGTPVAAATSIEAAGR